MRTQYKWPPWHVEAQTAQPRTLSESHTFAGSGGPARGRGELRSTQRTPSAKGVQGRGSSRLPQVKYVCRPWPGQTHLSLSLSRSTGRCPEHGRVKLGLGRYSSSPATTSAAGPMFEVPAPSAGSRLNLGHWLRGQNRSPSRPFGVSTQKPGARARARRQGGGALLLPARVTQHLVCRERSGQRCAPAWGTPWK